MKQTYEKRTSCGLIKFIHLNKKSWRDLDEGENSSVHHDAIDSDDPEWKVESLQIRPFKLLFFRNNYCLILSIIFIRFFIQQTKKDSKNVANDTQNEPEKESSTQVITTQLVHYRSDCSIDSWPNSWCRKVESKRQS